MSRQATSSYLALTPRLGPSRLVSPPPPAAVPGHVRRTLDSIAFTRWMCTTVPLASAFASAPAPSALWHGREKKHLESGLGCSQRAITDWGALQLPAAGTTASTYYKARSKFQALIPLSNQIYDG